ncbi:MAG TPA: VapE domain-containing protein, partial [Reyranella sp.]|nr:VapE domain-containing protein [Reyranella sp.]
MSGVSPTLELACALAARGLAVHWLKPRSKAPVADAWSTAAINTPDTLTRSWHETYNVGIRLGEPSKVGDYFLHVIDMDIRVADETEKALARLQQMLPDVDTLPFVISGSGGESRHFYFLTDRPFRSRKLTHSGRKFTDNAGKVHWTWEIDLFGTGKQVAAPPSIHPDTGKPYRWGRELEFDLIDMDLGPIVSADVVQSWGVGSSDISAVEEDDFAAEVHRRPLDLDDAEVQAILDDLPMDEWCDDREGWLQTGMALHHQYEGSDRGLEIWTAFSKKSVKFDGKDQRRVWDSFKGRLVPVRMPTLIKAAGIARLERDQGEDDGDADAFDEAAKDPEIAALLGGDQSAGDDIDAIGSEAANPERKWRQLLDLNEEGILKPTLHNLTLILRNDIRTKGIVEYNLFSEEFVQRRPPGIFQRRAKAAKPTIQLAESIFAVKDKVNGDLWTDSKDAGLRVMLEAPRTQGGYGIRVTDRDLKAAIDIIGTNSAFHPVREYLSGLKWDGRPRVETLFIRYLGAEDNEYSRDVTRLTLLGAVARAFEPGHKFDFATILEGVQGKRKSTFIEILARYWFVELQGDFSDRKRMIEKTQGSWICELPELTQFGKTDVEEIKAFISAKGDKDRLAYERRAKRFERQFILIGSTNRDEYLRDETGGRRFWPIACTVNEIDTDTFEKEVDQVWAEAVALYREMRQRQPRGTLPLYLR